MLHCTKYLLLCCIWKNPSFILFVLKIFLCCSSSPLLPPLTISHLSQVQVPCQPSPLSRWLLKVGHHLTAAYLRPPYSCCLFIGPYFSALSSPPVRLLGSGPSRPFANSKPSPLRHFSSHHNHSISSAFVRLNYSLILFSFENTIWNVAFGYRKKEIFSNGTSI